MRAHTCPDDHRHGETLTCYSTHGCRCAPCGLKHATWQADWRSRSGGGAHSTLRNPQMASEHLAALLALGYTRIRLGEDWGLSQKIIRNVLAQSGQIMSDTEEAIVTIPLEPPTRKVKRGHLVPARGYRRRVEALAAVGWSARAIAEQSGLVAATIGPRSATVQVETLARLCAAYSVMWDKRPPLETQYQRGVYIRTLNRARRNRWVPPMAWDDIDNDEAPAVAERDLSIDEIAVELACAGEAVHITVAERRAAITLLHSRRYADPLIAETLGLWPETVQRIRADELHLPAHPTGNSTHSIQHSSRRTAA